MSPGQRRGPATTPAPENAATTTKQVRPESTTARQRQATARPDRVSTGDAQLFDFARAHVARVRARCPQHLLVDEAVWTAAVLVHLAPLPVDRPWLHRRWRSPRGEASWCGGVVGLHLPPQLRGAA